MPTYVYKNLTTGETFEVKQSIREDALSTHPETGDPVQRMIQPVGIAFKGSGFYVNDSKGKNSASSGSKDPSTSTTSDSSDSTKSDGSSASSEASSSVKDSSTKDSSSTAASSTTSTKTDS